MEGAAGRRKQRRPVTPSMLFYRLYEKTIISHSHCHSCHYDGIVLKGRKLRQPQASRNGREDHLRLHAIQRKFRKPLL